MSSLFLKLPLPARQLALVLKGGQHRVMRYGETYRSTLRLLRESEYWSDEKFEAYQKHQLAHLLIEAMNGTEHYAEALSSFSPGDLEEIARTGHLKALPFLPKEVLKNAPKRVFNRKRQAAVVTKTSGSTGSPMEVQYDKESMQRRFAYFHRHREWAGADPFARTVHFSGHHFVSIDRRSPPFWMANPFENQLLVSTYHLQAEHLPAICGRIQRFRPEIMHGYPSAIAVIAQFARDQGLTFPALKAVLTTAETIDPEVRSAIEAGLKVKVFDYYSASEGVPIVQECEHGRMHLRPESGIFEIIGPHGDEVEPGETGEIVATSFVQWKTPLIRYRTGDMARRAPVGVTCACGRTLPFVDSVLGRFEDLIYTKGGQWMGLFSHRIFKGMRGVVESQIIQYTPETFEVTIVPDGTRQFDAMCVELSERFEKVLSYKAEINFTQGQRIPRGANGKFRTVQRRFDPSK